MLSALRFTPPPPLFRMQGVVAVGCSTSQLLFQSLSPFQLLPTSRAIRQTRSNLDSQVRYRSNRSRRGLYDGKDIRTGNNVSFSMKATKRTFKPNVFKKRVYSDVLDAMIPFHLTASTLRSIDKAGGLDNYLLNNKSITEGEGLDIKKKILKRLKNQAKIEQSTQLAA